MRLNLFGKCICPFGDRSALAFPSKQQDQILAATIHYQYNPKEIVGLPGSVILE
jgi:hypothetical protein